MYTISKMFSFEASHQLSGLPEGHQCSRNHGHSYRVELVLQSTRLDEIGFVLDYGKLDRFGDYLKVNFDHRFLNDVLHIQPSAENIAEHLFERAHGWWPLVVEVKVSETQRTWASYRPN